MNIPAWLRRQPLRLRDALRGPWRSFNRWRRERWPVRVVVILLLGAYFLSFRVFRADLAGSIATSAEVELSASEARVAATAARAYKAQETDRLRRALRVCLDADRDGAIGSGEEEEMRRLGLGPGDLRGAVQELDLDLLVDASRRAGLVPATCTAKGVRRAAFGFGQREAELLLVPAKRELEALLSTPPGRWSLRAWWRAAVALYSLAMFTLGMADGVTAIAWLFVCYLGGRLAVLLWGERGRSVAPWTPVAVLLLLGALASWLAPDKAVDFDMEILGEIEFWQLRNPVDFGDLLFHTPILLARVTGWAVLSFCAAYAGSRAKSTAKDPTSTVMRLTSCLGAVVLAWGVLSMYMYLACYRLACIWLDYPNWSWAGGRLSGVFMTWAIPFGVKVLGAVAGALTIAYALFKTRVRKLVQKRIDREIGDKEQMACTLCGKHVPASDGRAKIGYRAARNWIRVCFHCNECLRRSRLHYIILLCFIAAVIVALICATLLS